MLIIVLYLIIISLILVVSPFLFILCHLFSQLYLYYLRINFYLLLVTNFFIALFWYFCFHYYLALLISTTDFSQTFDSDVFILTDPWVLTTLLNNSLITESIFRSLFVETCVLLHVFGKNLHLTIVIFNIF